MKTFPRLLRELPRKVPYADLSGIIDSYKVISKQNLPYFTRLSVDESMRLVLSTWFSNNGMEESAEDLMTTDKVYLMAVLEESDEVGYKTCEFCDGVGRVDCEWCDEGSFACDECGSSGHIDCEECEGSGEDENGETCDECNGDGDDACPVCDDGFIECDNCDGRGDFRCEDCDGDGFIEVEDSVKYFYYVYILTRMSQVKEIENSFMVENKIPQNYIIKNEVTVEKIDDFDTPHKVYFMSDFTLEDFGKYFLDSPFNKYSQRGSPIITSFRRRLNDQIFQEHYE